MPSTNTSNLNLEKPADGEQSGEWGDTINSNMELIDAAVATKTGSETLTNKTLTSPVLNTGVSGTAVKDENNMASDSATHLATQQSIKAYADSVSNTKNRIDNPSGVINQRGAQTGLVNGWVADRWYFGTLSPSVVSTNTVSGFIEVDVTTVDTSIVAGDYAYLQQSIEGFNTSDLLIGTASARTITISFKHKHTKTGINCVALTNGLANRSYIFEYTQSVSNTEESHSETVTLDTAGTWYGDTNATGLKIIFGAMSGTTYHGAADTWLATNDFATSNQVNNMDSTSNFFRITDVQIEEGTVATPLEYEHYEVTLAKCQRYLPVLRADTVDKVMGLMGMNYSTTVSLLPHVFKVQPRSKITGITVSAATDFSLTLANSGRQVSTAIAFNAGFPDGVMLVVTVAANLVAGDATTLWSAASGGDDALILFTGAEL